MSSVIHDGADTGWILLKRKRRKKEFTVPIEIYSFIQNYVLENGNSPASKLFDITERTVQNHLQMV